MNGTFHDEENKPPKRLSCRCFSSGRLAETCLEVDAVEMECHISVHGLRLLNRTRRKVAPLVPNFDKGPVGVQVDEYEDANGNRRHISFVNTYVTRRSVHALTVRISSGVEWDDSRGNIC